MSIDFMVFCPEVAPRESKAFRRWYREQTDWAEDNDDYCQPSVTAPAIQSWYHRMTSSFPDANQPLANPESVDETYGDYNFGPHICYVSFQPIVADRSWSLIRSLAADCDLGTYDPNSDDERSDECIQFPAGSPPKDAPVKRRLFGLRSWGQ